MRLAAVFLCAIQAAPAAEEIRWLAIDFSQSADSLQSLSFKDGSNAAREMEIGIGSSIYSDRGRALSYAGEDKGLLAFLLGASPAPASVGLISSELNFRTVGLGTQIVDDRAVARALLAPWKNRSWLIALSPSIQIDEEKLRRHLSSPKTAKLLETRLQNLFRDAHAAQNSSQPKSPKWGYPNLGVEGELEFGDFENEALFAFRSSGETRRVVHRAELATGGLIIDDGILAEKSGAISFSLDLGSLISDDLLFAGRSAHSGKGQILVDGIPLADWSPAMEKGFWGEAAIRIPNRLLGGKEKAQFEIRPLPGEIVSVFHLQILRLPQPESQYLSDLGLPKRLDIAADQSAAGTPLVIGGYRFLKGIGMRAPGEFDFALEGNEKWFEAFAGVDATSPRKGPLVFRVLIDGEQKFKSRAISPEEAPLTINVPLEGGKKLTLKAEAVDAAGEWISADWAEARVF